MTEPMTYKCLAGFLTKNDSQTDPYRQLINGSTTTTTTTPKPMKTDM